MRAPIEAKLAVQALRQQWCVPQKQLPALVRVLIGIALNDKASHRNRTSAIKALQNVSKNNMDVLRTAIVLEQHEQLASRLEDLEKRCAALPPELAVWNGRSA
jgi:hypothetical protein